MDDGWLTGGDDSIPRLDGVVNIPAEASEQEIVISLGERHCETAYEFFATIKPRFKLENRAAWEYRDDGNWHQISNNDINTMVAAKDTIYVLPDNRAVWEYKGGGEWGQPITGFDVNTLVAARDTIYVLPENGAVWEYQGNGSWGNGPITGHDVKTLVAAGNTIYVLPEDRAVWEYQGNGSWGNGPITGRDVKTLVAARDTIYVLPDNSAVWEYQGNGSWGNGPITKRDVKTLVAARDTIYVLPDNSAVWEYQGDASWGNGPITKYDVNTLVAANDTIYVLPDNRGVWEYQDNRSWGNGPITKYDVKTLVADNHTIFVLPDNAAVWELKNGEFKKVTHNDIQAIEVAEDGRTINAYDEKNRLLTYFDGKLTRTYYDTQFGYGLLDAQAAVANATGTTIADVLDFGGANDWNLNMVNAPEVWAQGFTGQGVVVAVVDTGVDFNHWDLNNNIWRNPGEIQDGVDNDGNGFVDDVVGWDFVDNNWLPFDLDGHGTHVAGTIAGEANGLGVTGVAPNAQIMAVRVLGTGTTTWDPVAEGIRYAANNGADVINMSLGINAGGRQAVKDAIEYAVNQGVVVVSAAGNWPRSKGLGYTDRGEPTYPARYATEMGIAVGAVDSTNQMTDFSHRAGNEQMDYVVAPGAGVYSIDRYNRYDDTPDGFAEANGTSMAAPHVAGVAALMLSANPNLTPEQVEYHITATANPSGITVSSAATTSSSSTTSAYTAGSYVSGQAFGKDIATEEFYVEITRDDQASHRHVASTFHHDRSSRSRIVRRWTADINGSLRDTTSTDGAWNPFNEHASVQRRLEPVFDEHNDIEEVRNERTGHSAIHRWFTERDSEVVDDFFAKFQR